MYHIADALLLIYVLRRYYFQYYKDNITLINRHYNCRYIVTSNLTNVLHVIH